MNFKITKAKIISSIIFFILIDFFLSYKVACLYPSGLVNGVCPYWTQQIFSLGFLFYSLIFTLVFYAIWSLLQKE